jgi:hypothetical protein
LFAGCFSGCLLVVCWLFAGCFADLSVRWLFADLFVRWLFADLFVRWFSFGCLLIYLFAELVSVVHCFARLNSHCFVVFLYVCCCFCMFATVFVCLLLQCISLTAFWAPFLVVCYGFCMFAAVFVIAFQFLIGVHSELHSNVFVCLFAAFSTVFRMFLV